MLRFVKSLLTRAGFVTSPATTCGTSRKHSRPLCSRARPELESLESRLVPAITYHGGPIIPNVKVEAVFLGSAWSTRADLAAQAQDLKVFLTDLTASSYMSGLAQYPMTNANGTKTSPGTGSFGGIDLATNVILPTTTDPTSPYSKTNGSITDTALQTLLQTEINSNKVSSPNSNTLYIIFLPPGINNLTDAVKSWGGHHTAFLNGYPAGGTPPKGTNPAEVNFAVIEHPEALGGYGYTGGTGHETEFQALTESVSHEMVEAITDPLVSTKQAWDEIGDPAQNLPSGIGVKDGYMVAKYWSNLAGTGVVPGGTTYQALQTVSNLTGAVINLGGLTAGTFTSTQMDIQAFTYSNTQHTAATFTGLWGTQSIQGSLSIDRVSDNISITIFNPSGSGNLLTGTITSPDGDFVGASQNLELKGTATSSGKAVAVFGRGYYVAPSLPAPVNGPPPAGKGPFTPPSHIIPPRVGG